MIPCNMEESIEQIYVQYKGMIRKMITSIVVNNPAIIDPQDLQQAGALALVVALQSYDPSAGSLPSYIRQCVRNAILDQANSFNSVFTVDEKVRRQANRIIKMRNQGLNDEEIITRLGIKTRATFLALTQLVDNSSIELENAYIEGDMSIDTDDIIRMLSEIGLSKLEKRFVDLVITNHSMDEIMDKMNLGRSRLYEIKASIRDKILAERQD